MVKMKPMAKIISKINIFPASALPMILALWIAGCATPPAKPPATPVVDPVQIGNPKAGFAVTLRCDRQALHIGEAVRLDLRTAAPGYLNLYFINSSGQTGQLLTNYPVQANEPATFPPAGGKKLRYAPSSPPGVETFILVATRQPLNLLRRADIKNVKKPRTPVAELNMNGSQLVGRLRGALQRWPTPDWNATSIHSPLLAPGSRT